MMLVVVVLQHTLFDFGCSRVTGFYTYCFMAGLYTGGCMQHTLFDFGCSRVTGSYTYCFMVGLYTGGCVQHTLFDFGCSRVTGSYTYCFMVGLYTGSCLILVVLVLQAPTRTASWWVCTQAAVRFWLFSCYRLLHVLLSGGSVHRRLFRASLPPCL